MGCIKIYSIDYIIENNIDKKAYGFIYITTNLVNEKKYIGQRKFSNDWQYYLGSGEIFKRALKKYKRKNFSRMIMYISYSKDDLNQLEKYYIELYDAVKSLYYYNIAEGGKAGNTFAGKTDEEMAIIISKMKNNRIRLSGKNHPNYGKRRSDKAKKRMSDAHIGLRCGENHPNAKEVICITTGEVFVTAKEASKEYNINRPHISSCCRESRKSAGKHPETGEKLVWMYYEEWLKLKDGECNK